MAFPAKNCVCFEVTKGFLNDFFGYQATCSLLPSGVGPDARQQPYSSTQCRRGVHLPSIGISASHCTKMLGLSGVGVAVTVAGFPPNFSWVTKSWR